MQRRLLNLQLTRQPQETLGFKIKPESNRVSTVHANQAAFKAGLCVDDQIVSVNGKRVDRAGALHEILQLKQQSIFTFALEIQRGVTALLPQEVTVAQKQVEAPMSKKRPLQTPREPAKKHRTKSPAQSEEEAHLAAFFAYSELQRKRVVKKQRGVTIAELGLVLAQSWLEINTNRRKKFADAASAPQPTKRCVFCYEEFVSGAASDNRCRIEHNIIDWSREGQVAHGQLRWTSECSRCKECFSCTADDDGWRANTDGHCYDGIHSADPQRRSKHWVEEAASNEDEDADCDNNDDDANADEDCDNDDYDDDDGEE